MASSGAIGAFRGLSESRSTLDLCGGEHEEMGAVLYKREGARVSSWKLIFLARRVDQYFFSTVFKGGSFNGHLVSPGKNRDILEKEALTLDLWRARGVEVPRSELQPDCLAVEFFPDAVSYRTLLQDKFSPGKYAELLSVYDQIRTLAKRERNPDLFHSDPHMGNFLYRPGRDRAIPIDPGCLLSAKIDFKDIDSHLLAYSLSSIGGLGASEGELTHYFKGFKEMLSRDEVDRVVGLRKDPSALSRVYFGVRGLAVLLLKQRKSLFSASARNSFLEKFADA